MISVRMQVPACGMKAMENWWGLVIADFSDLPDPARALRIAVRLLIAALLGGVLGYERQRCGKAAGLRTHMLVALGAALFVLVPQQAGMSIGELGRVIQGLATGIGFIGAGAILKLTEQHEIQGLTTAAGLWLTTTVGIAAGLGSESSAILGTLLALLILSVVGRLEHSMGGDEKHLNDD